MGLCCPSLQYTATRVSNEATEIQDNRVLGTEHPLLYYISTARHTINYTTYSSVRSNS